MKFRINKDFYTTKKAQLSCAEILKLVGGTTDTHALYTKRIGDQPLRIAASERVTMADGMQFVTLPLDQTDGSNP